MRRRSLAVLVLIGLPLGYLAFTFVQVVAASRHDGARRADAIVVFGAAQYNGRPSPVLAARLDHALTLYRRRLAPTVVVTGGRRPGDRYTEATAAADYLLARRVPDHDILREVQGRNSWESLAAAAHELRRRHLTTVVMVSDPFHAARIEAMAEELGLDATVSPTRTSPIRGWSEVGRMVREAGAVAVGRAIGFRRLMRVRARVVTA